MELDINSSEQKLFSIIKNAPLGIIEIDQTGAIRNVNIKGEELLAPILLRHQLTFNNLFPIFKHINVSLTERIQNYQEEAGLIVHNEIYHFLMPAPDGDVEVIYNISANKMDALCIIVSFDDITEKHLKEEALRLAILNKAVDEGKYEIASGVLHDIGNAVVGLGSHLTRIRRAVEQGNPETLQNLLLFFKQNTQALQSALGEAKSQAIIDLLSGITEIQITQHETINKAITEQLNIVNHIQEILNIHRQYLTGRETQERKAVNLRSIINDCLAMLLASADKKAIAISLNFPAEQPVIKGDRTKLMQVILNILKNSIEAIDINAPEKNIAISLYTQASKLILQVQDSGSGFDEEKSKLIFTRGFTTKSTGTGLGLYNCKTIIESHAGAISVISDGIGMGAVTTIEFPIQQPE